jgi:hypothetical protein
MKTLESKSNRLKYVNFAAIGAATALASTGANATIISVTGLNQDVPDGILLSDIGGMLGVTIDRSDDKYTQLGSSTGGLTNSLVAGTVVGPGTIFTFSGSDTGTLTSKSTVDQSGLFGVEFDAGAGAQYGWLDIQTATNIPRAIVTLNGWGYETDIGVSIEAGETATSVNAPAGLALLAIGAMGLAASRRRKVKPAISA